MNHRLPLLQRLQNGHPPIEVVVFGVVFRSVDELDELFVFGEDEAFGDPVSDEGAKGFPVGVDVD